MPVMNFADIPDAEDYSLIPPGWYLGEWHHSKTEHRDGVETWQYRMQIVNGPYAGRSILDQISWVPMRLIKDDAKKRASAQRCKLVVHRMGFDVDQTLDYQPEHLEGCHAMFKLIHKPYTNPSTDEEKINNGIDFAGYERPDVWQDKQQAEQIVAASAGHGKKRTQAASTQPAVARTSVPAGVIQEADFLDDIPF